MISKEALDLVSALRPFASSLGQRVIDTVLGLAEEIVGPEIGGLELDSLGQKAQGLFEDTLESAVALFLVIVVLWLSRASVTRRGLGETGKTESGSVKSPASGPSSAK